MEEVADAAGMLSGKSGRRARAALRQARRPQPSIERRLLRIWKASSRHESRDNIALMGESLLAFADRACRDAVET